ncbi:MAG TPA: GGDEF domain-containing protein, partial [Henriciella sp.]|nr:GGDEF domain-containing protein [Henriciella sp.]
RALLPIAPAMQGVDQRHIYFVVDIQNFTELGDTTSSLICNKPRMRRFVSLLSNFVEQKPTRLPILVSGTAISLATISASVTVALGLHHNGALFIATAIFISCAIAIPAGIIHYWREVDIAAHQEKLRELAATDTLTGVMNRRTFERVVETERARMDRSGDEAAIILFDLDWFKSINDNFGHAAGDEVLKTVAGLAGGVLRKPVDALARWGGEEFAILLTSVTIEQAYAVTERLRGVIEKAAFDDLAPGLSISASFGVTAFTGSSSLHQALSEADRALYEAKKAGRNRTVCKPRLDAKAIARAI